MTRKRGNESGFALLLVFVLAAVISIALYNELPRVAFEAQRQKEQLLIDRGEQYALAIKRFYVKNGRFPARMEDLENTNGQRYLRRKYKDPMTNSDEWRIIHVGPGGYLTDSVVQPPNPLAKEGAAAGSGLGNQPNAPGASPASTTGTLPGQLGTFGQPNTTNPGMGGNVAGGPPVNPGLIRRPSDRSAVPGVPGLPTDPSNPDAENPPSDAQQQFEEIPADPSQVDGNGQPPIEGMPDPGAPGGNAPGVNPPGATPANPGATGPGTGGQVNPITPGGGIAPTPPAFNPNTTGTTGGTGQQPGRNTATDMIMGQLTTGNAQRPQQPAAASGPGGIQGGIAGVATKLESEGIKRYNERSKYNEWEFIFDLRKAQQDAMNPGGNNTNTNPLAPSQPQSPDRGNRR